MNPAQGNLLDKSFNAALAEQEGERGRDMALSPPAMEWTWWAEAWVEDQTTGSRFTADTVVAVLGLPTEANGYTLSNNALGAVMMRLAKRGEIRPVGYEASERVSSRGRVLRIWERC